MWLRGLLHNRSVGLVIDWRFHKRRGWVSIFAPFLVEAFIKRYDPVLLTSQLDYHLHKKKLRFILAMEPGWAAPKLRYDRNQRHTICVMASDPHNKTDWFQEYVFANNITYVLSQYYSPFFYHFPSFPPERFIHFPWAVPDQFLTPPPPSCRSNNVVLFGGRQSDAYDVRNWCRQQPGVTVYPYSGVENKALSDEGFFQWLARFDAVIAAGSSLPQYDLVTPKYFEIPAAGALLIGQRCTDLSRLGFNDRNALLFSQSDFTAKLTAYRQHPEHFQEMRRRGHALIKERHLISHRLTLLAELIAQTD